ncbi:MAG: ATP synthase subunit I [Myxococcota bacterium]
MGRILTNIAAFAAVLTAGAFLVGGVEPGIGALAGGAVAMANWVSLRWLGERIVGGGAGRVAASVLLAFKLVVLGIVCWLLIGRFGAHPVGFIVGVSAFVLGTLVGSSQGRTAAEEEG